MEKTYMLNGLKKIISEQVILDSKITLQHLSPETDLKNDLGIDSIDIINIAAEIENYFNIEIGYESIEKLHTVESCLHVIEQKITHSMVA